MARDVNLDMTAGEALVLLGALETEAAVRYRAWNRSIQLDSPDLAEREIAKTTALILDRLAGRVRDGLYPEDPETVILREQVELGMV